MLLVAILLLAPIPQNGGTAKMLSETPAVISNDSANDSSLSQPLPSAPDAKVKTDAEVAGGTGSTEASAPVLAPVEPAPVQPSYMLGSPAAVKAAGTRDYEATVNQRRLWYALVVTGHGAAVFDAWSTRRAISQGYGTEGNPLLRPFSHSGVMYAATQVSPAVMDFVGKRMMVSRHPWVRRMWWVPQAAGSGMSFSAGVHNVGLVP